MTARDITSQGGSVNGSRLNTYTNHTDFVSKSPLFYHRLIDTVHLKGSDHPLSIEHRVWDRVGTVTGNIPGNIIVYNNYPYDNSGVTFSHLTLPAMPSTADTITQVQAKTNPSRADVSVPNFLLELRELPEQLRLAGQKHHKKRSTNSVAEQNFGWLNLFRDIGTLLDFGASVNRRVTELRALHTTGLRRKRTVYSETVISAQPNVTFNSIAGTISGTVTTRTHGRRWGSIRWKPDVPGFTPDDELIRQARLTVHGWDFSSNGLASVVWEALPWSWFADYFGNVGDFFAANKNSVGGHAEGGCVMTQIDTTKTAIVMAHHSAYICTDTKIRYSTKSRVLESASLTFTEPFLKAQQLTTLLGIFANFGK